jgi:hypothetical protein
MEDETDGNRWESTSCMPLLAGRSSQLLIKQMSDRACSRVAQPVSRLLLSPAPVTEPPCTALPRVDPIPPPSAGRASHGYTRRVRRVRCAQWSPGPSVSQQRDSAPPAQGHRRSPAFPYRWAGIQQ